MIFLKKHQAKSIKNEFSSNFSYIFLDYFKYNLIQYIFTSNRQFLVSPCFHDWTAMRSERLEREIAKLLHIALLPVFLSRPEQIPACNALRSTLTLTAAFISISNYTTSSPVGRHDRLNRKSQLMWQSSLSSSSPPSLPERSMIRLAECKPDVLPPF